MPTDRRPVHDRRLVALHEAGHAVALMSLGRLPHSISIVASTDTHGGMVSEIEPGMMRKDEAEAEVIVLLAGRAAEESILGKVSDGAGDDLDRATRFVRCMLEQCGLGSRLSHTELPSRDEVEARLRDLYDRALLLVRKHQVAVETLANLVLKHWVLGRGLLAEFATMHGFHMRSFAVEHQEARNV